MRKVVKRTIRKGCNLLYWKQCKILLVGANILGIWKHSKKYAGDKGDAVQNDAQEGFENTGRGCADATTITNK